MIYQARTPSITLREATGGASRRPEPAESARSSSGPRLSQETQTLLIYVAIVATVAAVVFASLLTWGLVVVAVRSGSAWAVFPPAFGFCIAAALLYGNLMHQAASLGHLKRRRRHRPPTQDELDDLYDDNAPPVTILVPSYKENLHIVRQTLLSAALQEYPNRRVVLLIDDPPYPNDPKDLQALLAARRLPRELQALLTRQAGPLQKARDDFLRRKADGFIDPAEETRRLIRHFRQVATWFLRQAADAHTNDHMDRLFVEGVLLKRARAYAEHAAELRQLVQEGGHGLREEQLLREYERLASLFRVELTHFERKRFVNLSHELNKATNLNAYIGLIGKSFRTVVRTEGVELRESGPEEADLTVPDAKYVAVVDADSFLMNGYVLRLVHAMEQPENRRLAVAQSPYLPVPEAPGLLERTAAATVAAQYIVHLGFAHCQAVYWVGANAVLRKEALDEIRMPFRERGYTMVKYIQDRTHIEDTESTIDLVERGWTLYNCPDPLAYSATPADFGSLLIQRRRWANGGLIILPKLLGYLTFARRVPQRWLQGFMRVGYLLNLSLGSLAVLLTLLIPLPGSLIPCLAVAGLCYGLVYGADILRMGFRLRDLPHVYALNLMLTPVNLAGAAKSLRQAWTGRKTPFARTPKTKGRTWIPPRYIAAEYALLVFCLFVSIVSFSQGRTGHAMWAMGNAVVYLHIVVNLLWDDAPAPKVNVAAGGVTCGLSPRSR